MQYEAIGYPLTEYGKKILSEGRRVSFGSSGSGLGVRILENGDVELSYASEATFLIPKRLRREIADALLSGCSEDA
jgi:hypothetical protein